MEEFKEYPVENQIRVIVEEYKNEDGRKVIVYKCDKCGVHVTRLAHVNKGLVMCKRCKRIMSFRKRAEMKAKDPYWNGHYRMREYAELDRGKVWALYRAGRSIKWIADDMQAVPADVERMVNELRGGKQ